jgi:hypothetical protein
MASALASAGAFFLLGPPWLAQMGIHCGSMVQDNEREP